MQATDSVPTPFAAVAESAPPPPATETLWQGAAAQLYGVLKEQKIFDGVVSGIVRNFCINTLAEWLKYWTWLVTCTHLTVDTLRLDVETHIKQVNKYTPTLKNLIIFLANVQQEAGRIRTAAEFDRWRAAHVFKSWQTHSRYYAVTRDAEWRTTEQRRRNMRVYRWWYDDAVVSETARSNFCRSHAIGDVRASMTLYPVLAYMLGVSWGVYLQIKDAGDDKQNFVDSTVRAITNDRPDRVATARPTTTPTPALPPPTEIDQISESETDTDTEEDAGVPADEMGVVDQFESTPVPAPVPAPTPAPAANAEETMFRIFQDLT